MESKAIWIFSFLFPVLLSGQTIQYSGPICVGETVILTCTSCGTPPAAPFSAWTSSNNSVATIDINGNVTGISPGTATIQYTDNSSPPNVVSTSIDVLSKAQTPTITGSGGAIEYCVNASASALTVNPQIGGDHLWFNEDGTSTMGGSGAAPTPSTILSAVGTTNYKVIFYPYNSTALCPSDPLIYPVIVHPNPVITTTVSPPNVCSGSSVTLSASGAGPGGSYFWDGGITNNASITYTPLTTTTYSVEGEDQYGCEGTGNATVTVNAAPSPPTPDPSNTIQYCLGAPATTLNVSPVITGNAYTWYDASNNVLSTSTGPTPSTSTLGSTLYKVSQTDVNGCESSTLNITVTVNALPSISVVGGSSQPVCAGETVTLNGSGAGSGGTYIWLDASGNTFTNGVSFTPSATTTYTVTGTDANGCTGTDQVTVTVNAIPSAPTVNPSNLTQYCLGATAASMSAVSISGYTLKWYDNADNLLATGSVGPVPSTVVAGSTTYKVTQTNGTTQCESSALPVTVIVNALPSISVVGGAPAPVCDGFPITLNGAGGVNYSWSGLDASGITITNGASFVPPGSTTTTYIVTGTDGNQCSNTSSVNVTSGSPSINAGLDDDVCAGETVTLNGSGAGSGGTYIWLDASGNTFTNGVSFTPSATTTYTVTGTDANGCTGTDQVTVTVNAIPSAPTVNPSNLTQYCLGATAASMSAVSISGYTLKWYDNADNLLATGSVGPVPSTVVAGSTTYKVTQTNGTTQCESSALPVTVIVNALPSISVVGGASQTVCDGSSITLNGAGGVSYSWSGLDASGNAITNGASFVPPGSTTTTYIVTGTDGNQCSNTSSVNVTSGSPSINAGLDDDVCAGETVTLNGSGAGSGGTYIWLDASGNTFTNGVSFTPSATTTYTVTGTDANGCTGTDQVTVTVNAIPSAPTVNPSNLTQYCLGATAASMSAVSISGYTLKWYDNADNLLATGSVGPVPSTVVAGSTTYKVTQTNGTTQCESSALPVTVIVNALPSISVVGGASQTVCDGSSITLNGAGGVSYSWSGLDASGNAITNGASFVPPGSTTTTYIVTGTDGNQCSNTSSVNVTSGSPSINAGLDDDVCAGETVTLNGSGAGSGGTYIWLDASGNTFTNGVSFTPSATTTYTVTGTDANGCTGTDQVTVTVNAIPSPPTVDLNSPISFTVGSTSSSLSAFPLPGHTLKWYNGNGTQVNGNGSAPVPSTSINKLGITNYYVSQVNNSTGCESTFLNIQILVFRVNMSSDTIICLGATATLNANSTNASVSSWSYLWSTGDNTSTTVVSPVTNTKYWVQISNTIDTWHDTVNVEVDQIAVSITQTDSILCAGESSGTLKTSVSAGYGSYQYLWNTGSTIDSLYNISIGTYSVVVTDSIGCSAMETYIVSEPLHLSLSSSSPTNAYGNQIDCYGDLTGTVYTVLSGGVGNYNYLWSNGTVLDSLNNISAGTYWVIAQDGNGCSITDTILITQPLPLTTTGSVVSNYNGYGVSCDGLNDGSINVNAQGSNTPYSYLWSNGANTSTQSALPAGMYTVLVTDYLGCESTTTVSISEPNAVSYAYVINDVRCFNGSDGTAEIIPNGGVMPYQISWEDGSDSTYIDSLTSGYYMFSVQDENNCTVVDSIEIYQPTDISVIIDTNQPTCIRINDGEINAFVSGGTYPYTYRINNTPTLLPIDSAAAGSYVMTVVDSNSCTKSIAFDLTPLQTECFMIPNMYSPNYDGYNDEFRINHSSWSSYTVKIYNPVGHLMYSGNETTNWDGFSNGEPVPVGDYYYLLITDEGESIYGYVTLIR